MFNSYYLPYSQWNNQMLARRFPIRRINGIPEMRTISVSTTGTVVTYQLCPWRFKQLRSEGLMLLRVSQVPSAGAGSSAYTVSLEVNSNPQTGSTGTPLIDSLGNTITSDKVVNGNFLLVYYNKCQGVFQVINYLA